MGFLREVELGVSFGPFSAFREHFGFVPSLFRCQSLLPRLVEAETGLLASILFKDRSLSRLQKERLLLLLAAEVDFGAGRQTHVDNDFANLGVEVRTETQCVAVGFCHPGVCRISAYRPQ